VSISSASPHSGHMGGGGTLIQSCSGVAGGSHVGEYAKIGNEDPSMWNRWKLIPEYCITGFAFRLLFVYT